MNLKTDAILAGVALVAILAAAIYLKKKVTDVMGGILDDPEGAGAAVADTVTNAAGGVIAGTAQGVGGWFGVPRTEQTACEKAKASGSAWDASFSCPAGDFLSYVWNR